MKNRMNYLKKSVLLAVIALSTLGCSDDDGPSGTKVRYTARTSANIFASVSFRGPAGNFEGVPVELLQNEWAKTIHVNPPFNASVVASFNNTTSTTQNYSLNIYVDDELVETVSGTVSPGVTSSGNLTADIPQN